MYSLLNVKYTLHLCKHFTMIHKLLFPSSYKLTGWIILIPALIAGVYLTLTGFESDWLHARVPALISSDIFGKKRAFTVLDVNLTNTVVGSLFIIGAILVGFSKEKNEDEFIGNLRLSSLLWAVFVNYTLLLLAFLFVYETAFLSVMIYNMFTVLLIFITRFNYILYKSSKTASDEK